MKRWAAGLALSSPWSYRERAKLGGQDQPTMRVCWVGGYNLGGGLLGLGWVLGGRQSGMSVKLFVCLFSHIDLFKPWHGSGRVVDLDGWMGQLMTSGPRPHHEIWFREGAAGYLCCLLEIRGGWRVARGTAGGIGK
jgi:hypothetical protein